MNGNAVVIRCAPVDLRVRFLADGCYRHRQALRPCRAKQEKRKAAVAGDEAEFHVYIITPRWLRSRNAASIATSSPSSSLIFSSACEVFIFADSSSRNAFCSTASRSGANPRRARPILLIPNALFSRGDDVSENGSTSWVTIVPPPMNAYLPT